MDVFRAKGAPAIQIHESCSDSPEQRNFSRSPSKDSPTPSTPARPMTIPNVPCDELAPPPLPPPTHIEDLSHGFDPGWTWGNSHAGISFGGTKLAPIRQGSSLQGGYLYDPAGARGESERPDTEMKDVSDGSDRRGSSVSTLRSLPSLEHRQSLPGPAQAELQGERPLALRTLERSSTAYDKHLLSKLTVGGFPSAPRLGPRSDSIPSARTFNPPDVHPRSLSSVEVPTFRDHVSPADPPSGLSPNARTTWRDHPGFPDGSRAGVGTSSTGELDPWHSWRQRESRHSTSGSISAPYDDNTSISSRSNRGSYDQNTPADFDVEQAADETRAFGKLYIDDRTPLQADRRSSRQGQKRRRRSQSRERVQDTGFLSHLNTNMEGSQRSFPPSSYPRSPNTHNLPHHGSVSSVSSAGPRQGSYASSTAYSIGRSSITSMSSFDKSPGGLSPRSDLDAMQDSHHVISANISSLPSRPLKPATSEIKSSTSLPVKTVGQSTSRAKPATKPTGAFVCACCPKKPKRFATAEDLRLHTTEKQYECSYCGNRFKNKNEAERHQNSLHLRLHSWSCAAIAGPEAAFHPTNASSTPSPGFTLTDSCGYCGEEFPNSPRPDWDARKEHLMTVHKFGECNKAKKFYRADHFRQHLKHSHAGTSGKWTNMLENACMRDEPPTEEGFSPTAEGSVTNEDENE